MQATPEHLRVIAKSYCQASSNNRHKTVVPIKNCERDKTIAEPFFSIWLVPKLSCHLCLLDHGNQPLLTPLSPGAAATGPNAIQDHVIFKCRDQLRTIITFEVRNSFQFELASRHGQPRGGQWGNYSKRWGSLPNAPRRPRMEGAPPGSIFDLIRQAVIKCGH